MHTYINHITLSGKEGGWWGWTRRDLLVPCAWPLPLPCAWPLQLPVCASTNFRHFLMSSDSSASLRWHMRIYIVYACCLCLLIRIFLRVWGICWANKNPYLSKKLARKSWLWKMKDKPFTKFTHITPYHRHKSSTLGAMDTTQRVYSTQHNESRPCARSWTCACLLSCLAPLVRHEWHVRNQ